MNIILFIVLLFGLQIICLIVGGYSSRGMNNHDDYFLASKKVAFFPLIMTFLATQIGGGLILGSAEEAFRYGWVVLLYPMGAVLGLLLLGCGVGRRLARFQVATVAQLFEVVYRSTTLKKIASLLSILSLFMILVAQIIASNKFMVSLGLESPLWSIAFWGLVIFYTAAGGMKAVVATDIIQASFFVVVFVGSFIYVACGVGLPFSATTFSNMFSSTTHLAASDIKVCGWLLMPLLFMVIEQDMAQRCFSAKSPKTVSKAAIVAGIAAFFLSLVPITFGVIAQQMAITVPPGASVMMVAVETLTNPSIMAFVGCAILAAIISTADSLINAVSSNLSQDFGWSFSTRDTIRFSQMLSTVIALLAIAVSFYFDNIVDLLIQSYELSVVCLFVPVAIALFKREGNTLSATLAIAGGLLGFVLFRAIPTEFPRELAAILLSLTGYLLGELLVRATAPTALPHRSSISVE